MMILFVCACRNPRHTKHKHYQKFKPSKCQMKLCVETITPHVEANGHQTEPQPLQCQPSQPPKVITQDIKKPLHSIKISPNSKRMKKRKSRSPSKEKMKKSEKDKEEESKFQEEAIRSEKEGVEEVEDNPLECSTVMNGRKTEQ